MACGTPLGRLLDRNRVADVGPLTHLGRLENLLLAANAVADLSLLADLVSLRRLNLGGKRGGGHLPARRSRHAGVAALAVASRRGRMPRRVRPGVTRPFAPSPCFARPCGQRRHDLVGEFTILPVCQVRPNPA